MFAKITFYYRDLSGRIQAGELTVDSATSLVHIHVHDDFQIRVNPNRPTSFYSGKASSFHTEFRPTVLGFGNLHRIGSARQRASPLTPLR